MSGFAGLTLENVKKKIHDKKGGEKEKKALHITMTSI